jgi:hypothetical protein
MVKYINNTLYTHSTGERIFSIAVDRVVHPIIEYYSTVPKTYHPNKNASEGTKTMIILSPTNTMKCLLVAILVNGIADSMAFLASTTSNEHETTKMGRRMTKSTICARAPSLVPNSADDVSRHNFLMQSILIPSLAILSVPVTALAKDTTEADDKAKILSGYQRLTYLLDNWDKETTFCGTKVDPYSGKQICEKSPLIVRDYMGYKSINDPLFKAEKTLRRLESLVPPNRETDFLDAVERWQMTADEASGMAYTSSWAGPQNPNGGDDAIDYYLDRAKKQVVDARNVLALVIDILDLKQT